MRVSAPVRVYKAFLLASIVFTASSASAFAPSSLRTFTVLSSSSNSDPNANGNRNAPLTQSFSTADAATATSSVPETAAPPKSDNNDAANPYKVYELPPTTPPLVSIPTVASVVVATVGTFVLNNYLNLGPVQASSVAGLVATMVLPEKLALAALCGSFAGMAKLAVIGSSSGGIAASGILGLLCASVLSFLDYKKWFVGMGGRLGFAAQCACTAQFIVTSLLTIAIGGGAPTESTAAALVGRVSSWRTVLLQLPQVTAFTVLGALFMKYWKEFFAQKATQSPRLSNSVAAVGATGLVSSLLLPASLAGPAFCGSFVAMSAPTKLPSVFALIGASALAGVSQQAMAGVMLGGWGGKLGTAAFLGVLGYTTLLNTLNKHKEASVASPASSAIATTPTPIAEPQTQIQTQQEQPTDAIVEQSIEPELQDDDDDDDDETTSSSSSPEDEMNSQQEAGLSDNLKQNYL